MTRIAILVLVSLAAAACSNTNHPTGAPSGIRAQNGGGEQQLGQVQGSNRGVGGSIATTRVQ